MSNFRSWTSDLIDQAMHHSSLCDDESHLDRIKPITTHHPRAPMANALLESNSHDSPENGKARV